MLLLKLGQQLTLHPFSPFWPTLLLLRQSPHDGEILAARAEAAEPDYVRYAGMSVDEMLAAQFRELAAAERKRA